MFLRSVNVNSIYNDGLLFWHPWTFAFEYIAKLITSVSCIGAQSTFYACRCHVAYIDNSRLLLVAKTIHLTITHICVCLMAMIPNVNGFWKTYHLHTRDLDTQNNYK